jgi:uncharacterized membrane protein (DUF485 family)
MRCPWAVRAQGGQRKGGAMAGTDDPGRQGVEFYRAPETAPHSATAADAVDWEAMEATPEFRELMQRKRRFVIPATIFFLCWYLGFIALAGYAEDFMGKSIYEGLTVGYVLALSQFVMVWGLTWWYLRKADDEFDPLERQVVDRALRGSELTETREPVDTREVVR